MKIETAEQAADTIAAMSPRKIEMLVAGLRRQHPHLRNASDAQIRALLRQFVQGNRHG